MTSASSTPDERKLRGHITAMFDRIARRYDLLNRIMTFGLDLWWRRRLVQRLSAEREPRVLDACTGTGDVARALCRRGHRVVGLDAAREMLRIARMRRGISDVRWCVGDCYALPFADGAFDAATMAFGIRNIGDRVAALRELARVVRPGGRLLVLEALLPRARWRRWLIARYERWMFPLMGMLLAGDRNAYVYLARSIAGFGSAARFEAELARAGWHVRKRQEMTGGAVALFEAVKPRISD